MRINPIVNAGKSLFDFTVQLFDGYVVDKLVLNREGVLVTSVTLAQEQARNVFESIAVDVLADVLSAQTTCDGKPYATEVHCRQARAVEDYLTGGASDVA